MEDLQTLIEKVKADLQDEKTEEDIFLSLHPFWGKEPQTDGEVAELLATVSHVKVAKLLQRMLVISEDKKIRKIIRRSLYKLKSKGVLVEEIPSDRGQSILHPLKVEPPKGFGSAIDFLGQRILILVIPHGGRGLSVIQGVISDTQGLVNFSAEEMSHKGFREFFENIKEISPFHLVEMEASYVGFLLVQGNQLTLEKRGTPFQDYLHLKNEIEKIKKDYEKPLIYSILQTDEWVENDWLLRRGGDLFKADVFSSWEIGEDLIRSYADEILEAEESRIVLNPAQKDARFQGIFQKALSELFTEERKLLYKRRLEEMAYFLFKVGREEETKIALTVAIDLEKPLNLIQPNPFLFQLVTKSIFSLLKDAHEKHSEELSLISKP